MRTDLAVAHQALDAAYNDVLIVQTEIEPSALSALEAAEEAFRHGKIGALDLLDAQRTLFAARQQYVDVQASYHQIMSVVERLVGGRYLKILPLSLTKRVPKLRVPGAI